jgi:hypothetical protein
MKICVLILVLTISNLAMANPRLTTLKDPGTPNYSSLIASVSYASNTAYFGRTYGLQTPLIGADLTYTTAKKLWFNIAAYSYYNEPSSEYDFGVGYDKKFNEKVKAGISYYHFEFPSTSVVPKSVSSDLISGYIKLSLRNFYSTLSTGYRFGESNDFYLSWMNSLYFEKDSIGRKLHSLSIEPRAGITLGTKEFSRVAEVKQITSKGNKGKGKNKKNETSPTIFTGTSPSTINRFVPLYFDFNIPITYYIKSFDLELRPRLLIPVNVDPGENSGPAFIMNATVYYNLYFNKKANKKTS